MGILMASGWWYTYTKKYEFVIWVLKKFPTESEKQIIFQTTSLGKL
jgi:hypothetical protein